MLPAVLGRIHPKWGAPYVAILVVFASALVSFFLPSSFSVLVPCRQHSGHAQNVATPPGRRWLVEHHPELHRRAKFMLTDGP